MEAIHDFAVVRLKDLLGPGHPRLIRVWSAVAMYGELRPIDIAKVTGINQPNVASTLRQLESMGFLKPGRKVGREKWIRSRAEPAPTALGTAVSLPADLLGSALIPSTPQGNRVDSPSEFLDIARKLAKAPLSPAVEAELFQRLVAARKRKQRGVQR
jgi:hypothetical protein